MVAPKQRCPCPDFVTADYWAAAPWFVKMGTLLLRERSLGAQSKLQAYVEQLPASFEAPVLWSAKQLEALQYPALIDKVRPGASARPEALRSDSGSLRWPRGWHATAATLVTRFLPPVGTSRVHHRPNPQVSAQRREWEALHRRLQAGGQPPGAPPVPLDAFLWALCAVRSRTFSGPYIGTSLPDRLKLGGLVGGLGLANVALGLADVERTLTAVIAVFTFNVLYEVILSRSGLPGAIILLCRAGAALWGHCG